jgi:hypothetical protein
MFTTRKTRNVYHMLMVNKLFNSQMPRHLISDAHEWINEIPTVPTYWWQKVYTYHPRSHRGRWFAEIVWCTPRGATGSTVSRSRLHGQIGRFRRRFICSAHRMMSP